MTLEVSIRERGLTLSRVTFGLITFNPRVRCKVRAAGNAPMPITDTNVSICAHDLNSGGSCMLCCRFNPRAL